MTKRTDTQQITGRRPENPGPKPDFTRGFMIIKKGIAANIGIAIGKTYLLKEDNILKIGRAHV